MSDISETELLEASSDSLQKKMHTALPAMVESYNHTDQTVTIKLMINQMDYKGDSLDLPPLVDVPVDMISYGQFFITGEPVKGDEGLAHFAERCIDGWWESGRASTPLDIRFNDLSDAFFKTGYKSRPNALKIVPNCLNIGSNSSYIRLLADGVIEINGTLFRVNCPAEFGSTVDATGIIKSMVDVQATGVSLVSHVHAGVQSGNSSTLPPTPTGG